MLFDKTFDYKRIILTKKRINSLDGVLLLPKSDFCIGINFFMTREDSLLGIRRVEIIQATISKIDVKGDSIILH